MSTKQTTKTKTANKANVATDNTDNEEQVAVGNWVADVRTKKDSAASGIRRKVITTGIAEFDLANCMPDVLTELRRGREVRFTCDGEDVIRLFPCLDKEFTSMFVCAQTMGNLRESLNDIQFQIVRKDGKQVSDMRRERREMVADRENNTRINVTPDTVVTCPECGAEFRIGKQLM